MLVNIIAIIIVLGFLIFFHELGHFIAAKLVGIRVERFSLGFPPRMIGKKIGETDYCISWIPFGGYVKMSGMIDESLDRKAIKGEPWEFQSKSTPQKIFVITSGVVMNFIVAFIIFSIIIYMMGIGEVVESTVVYNIIPGYPAEKIGIQAGDRIVSVNGIEVNKWSDMTEIIHNKPNQEILVEWKRNGEIFSSYIQTVSSKVPYRGTIKEIGMIGISPEVKVRTAGIFESIAQGGINTYFWSRLTLVSIKMLILGQESLKSIGGPILIAKLAGDSARTGVSHLFNLIAIISINLGFLNILPVPALDGGHLVFIIFEGLRRKPLSVKTKVIIQQVGLAIIIALMILVIYNDILRVM